MFQQVLLRWPTTTTAVAGSMIGEIGALGGGLVPNARGLSTQYLGTYYLWGFVLFAVMAVVMLAVRRAMQIRWPRAWAEKGGRAPMKPQAAEPERLVGLRQVG